MNQIKHGQKVRENILFFIISYIQQHGYPPCVREIGDAVNLKSTSSVYTHLTKMLEEGTLETDAEPGTPRALRVPGYEFKPTGSSDPKNQELISMRQCRELRKIFYELTQAPIITKAEGIEILKAVEKVYDRLEEEDGKTDQEETPEKNQTQ